MWFIQKTKIFMENIYCNKFWSNICHLPKGFEGDKLFDPGTTEVR